MAVRLELDSKALEKFFDSIDDEEVLIHVRQKILENVCKHRIKAIVPQEVSNLAESLIRDEVRQQIGYEPISSYEVKLSNKLVKKVLEEVKKAVKSAVDDILKPDLLQSLIKEAKDEIEIMVRGEIALSLNASMGYYIKDEVNKRLKKITESAFKEKE